MKKVVTLFLICSSLYGWAQQEPYFTHFKNIPSAYNPAAAGQHLGHICLGAVTHYQWRSFDDVTLIRGTDGDPTGTSIDNVAPETHHFNVASKLALGESGMHSLGVGLAVIDDNVGFTKNTSVLLDLNYKISLQGGYREIAIGTGLGMQQFGIVNPSFKWRDPNDPNIPLANGNVGKFNMNFGAYMTQQHLGPIDDFYTGLSVTQVTAAEYLNIAQNSTFSRKFVPHYYFLAGGDIPLTPAIVLEPAVLMKYAFLASSYTPQFDINATALFSETFRGGIGFRNWGNADALSLLIGYKAPSSLELGYSYDITVSNVGTVSNGTHEIMVKYCIPFSTTPKTEIIRLNTRWL